MNECEVPKRKQGRQTKYTPAKAKEILRRLASGETLTSICRDMQIPPSTVYQWTVDRNDFAVDFARAISAIRSWRMRLSISPTRWKKHLRRLIRSARNMERRAQSRKATPWHIAGSGQKSG